MEHTAFLSKINKKTLAVGLISALMAAAITASGAIAQQAAKLSVSNVTATNLDPNRAQITWTTNYPADAKVEYGLSTAYNDFVVKYESVTSHDVTLLNLSANTTYHYRVISVAAGEIATSGNQTFTTMALPTPPPSMPGPDGQPLPPEEIGGPIISNLAVTDISLTKATINWTTSEPATSTVQYGQAGSGYQETQSHTNLTTAHKVTLSNLKPGTTYQYQVISENANHKKTKSLPATFTTVALSPVTLETLGRAQADFAEIQRDFKIMQVTFRVMQSDYKKIQNDYKKLKEQLSKTKKVKRPTKEAKAGQSL